MKTLLFLNGTVGCQTGIEDGFKYLENEGLIDDLNWFYYQDFANNNSQSASRNKMLQIAQKIQPSLIVIFHLGDFFVDINFMDQLKKIPSNPRLVYDEGDMYGTWAKPISQQMINIISSVDAVSIRGLGQFRIDISKINDNVFYTSHHNDINRFNNKPYLLKDKKNDIVFIGNKVKPKLFSSIRRLPGAAQREKFVDIMSNAFPERFKLYGNGWENNSCNQGPIDFYKQNEVYKHSWITVAYEHYPSIPYYFSNRLPIALSNGSIYVCHYHIGYEKIFQNKDFIFFFETFDEAIDIIKYLNSLDDNDLYERSKRARKFASENFHPNVVWSKFFKNSFKL